MRILVISINYWPDLTGIAAFNTSRCEYLAAQGHQVTICTGPPYYPEWSVPEPYRGKLIQREERNGVTILRSWMFVPSLRNTTKRILHEASFLASSFIRALGSGKPDVIFAVSPPLGLGLVVVALGKLWGVPFIFDVEDLQPDAAVDLGMIKGKTVLRALYAIEKLAYRKATLVSTLSEEMRQRILKKGIDPEKVVLFPPHADASLYSLRKRTDGSAFREKFGLKGKFIVSHSGNMGVKQGLGVVIEAAAKSREREDIQFLIVGDGAMRSQLESQAREHGFKNVLFLPLQKPDSMFQEMLAATDIGLITQQRIVADIVFPSKTVTLLSAGCPVIAAVNCESKVAQVVEGSGAGLVVEPENPEALLAAIYMLAGNPDLLKRMSRKGREFAIETWSEERTLPQMERHFLYCTEQSSNEVPVEASAD